MADSDGVAIDRWNRGMEAVNRATDQDITAFLNSTGADPNCPSCHKNKWSILRPNEPGVIVHQLQYANRLEGMVVGGSILATVVMICQHCAFVRQHAAIALGDWLVRREEAPQKVQDTYGRL